MAKTWEELNREIDEFISITKQEVLEALKEIPEQEVNDVSFAELIGESYEHYRGYNFSTWEELISDLDNEYDFGVSVQAQIYLKDGKFIWVERTRIAFESDLF